MMKVNNINIDSIWAGALEKLTRKIEENKDRKILLLLSGGSVVAMYGRLGEFLKEYDGKIALGQVDERFRPKAKFKMQNAKCKINVDINKERIGETGLWNICEERGIPYFTVSGEGTLIESANEYNETMRQCFNEYNFKIAVLGIGEDGHTAGLIPGYGREWDREKLVVGYKLNHESRIKNQELRIKERITMTPRALRKLDDALVAAFGEKKKDALVRIVRDEKHHNIDQTPGIIIREIKSVDLITDQNI